jgi:hypothetical protein
MMHSRPQAWFAHLFTPRSARLRRTRGVAAIIGSAGRFTKRLNFFCKPQRPNHELARESEVL